MNVFVVCPVTGNGRDYSPADIRAAARAAVSGKGRLSAYWLTHDAGRLYVSAQFRQADGWSGSTRVELTYEGPRQ